MYLSKKVLIVVHAVPLINSDNEKSCVAIQGPFENIFIDKT